MMKKICVAAFWSSLALLSVATVQAQSVAQTQPYTSMWGDFQTVVPAGWAVRSDFEGSHFTDISFKSPEPYYGLSIRWYTRYSTHRLSDGVLEMYTSDDDYIHQMARLFYSGALIEPVHDLEVGGLKAKRFIARAGQPSVLPAKYGTLIGKDLLNSPGEHAYTVVPMPSGFYVLIYFAPKGGYEKYGKLYDLMVASFVPIKDGPGGAPLPGKTAVQKRPEEVLKQLVSQFQAQKDILFAIPDPNEKSPTRGWFGTGPRQMEEKIIEFVSSMTPPPAIPEEAKVEFIKANVFMKDAKDISDYKYAIEAYKKALFEAPWWGNAYYNLGMALEAAGQNDDAVESLKMYVLTKPSEADAAQAKTKIIEIQAKSELAERKAAELQAAMRAKYGANGSSSFGWDSLFRYGAVVQDMNFDASGNARTISLKIQTRKENGRLVNYLAIFDITSRSDTFGQVKFSTDWRGNYTFCLDDRGGGCGDPITLTATSFGDGDAKISIRPSGNASASIQTNLSDLFRERARQAVYAGGQTRIGEKVFYVLGQGGAKGALLFFPPEIKDKLEHGEVRDLSPMFVAVVNYRGPQGENERFTNADLGVLNGTHYHLELEGGSYAVKIGQGQNN